LQAGYTRVRPLACGKEPGILTPASPDSLPPLGDLIADEPFWRYPIGTARESVAHLRVWLTAGPEPGHLAVVTQTGPAASVTESAGQIWAELARRYGPSLVLLEHHRAPEAAEGGETLDLSRIGAGGSPHWLAVWPTTQDNPRHAGLELWMAVHAHQSVDKPASWFDSCEHQEAKLALIPSGAARPLQARQCRGRASLRVPSWGTTGIGRRR
jgi:hypothetical protein